MSTLNVDKVDPNTGTALEIGTSGDTITVPSGATFVVAGTTEITGTNNVQRPNVNPLIINGDMAINQRGDSTGVTATGYDCVDRWKNQSANFGTFSFSQSTDVPSGEGFKNSVKLDCTTADASYGASDHFTFQTRLEAQDLGVFKFGTSNAEKQTLSFWIKSNLTGNFVVLLYRSDSSRQCCQLVNIASADTWEKKIVNYPADTTGVPPVDSGDGLSVQFILGVGSDYTSGTLATTWAGYVAANYAVGQAINLSSSTSNEMFITGVQLEVGEYTSSTIPPFQHESYGDNLARCQRYYTKIAEGASQPIHIGYVYNSTQASATILLPNPMRETPSIDQTSGTSYYRFQADATNYAFDSFTFDYGTGNQVVAIRTTSISGLTGAQTGCFQATDASSYFAFDSEL